MLLFFLITIAITTNTAIAINIPITQPWLSISEIPLELAEFDDGDSLPWLTVVFSVFDSSDEPELLEEGEDGLSPGPLDPLEDPEEPLPSLYTVYWTVDDAEFPAESDAEHEVSYVPVLAVEGFGV